MKRVATLFLALCVLTSARADIGPPPGKKLVPVTTIVEAAESYPDYAFFEISWSSRPGPPPHGGSSRSVTLHFVAPGTTLKATGARRSGGALYAVPRHVAEGIPGWKGFAADAEKHSPPKHSTVNASDERFFALAQSVRAGDVPGAISIPFGVSEELPTSDPRTAITVHYRIARTPAGVAFVKPGEPTPGLDGRTEGDPSLNESAFPWQWIAAGGAGSLALLLGGVWLARRSGRRA